MTLSLIGAGLPRTGTLSLKAAVEMLGFAPCHHMREVFAHPHLAPLWERAFDGTLHDWEEIFAGYRATVDAPAVYFYDTLAEHYPDARIILTVRDEDRWYDSIARTIMSPEHRARVNASRFQAMMEKMIAYQRRRFGLAPIAGGASTGPAPKDVMVPMYRRHNETVEREFGPQRLLVFNVAEGWEPLCRFLGKPVPETPFPRLNDSTEFHAVRLGEA